MRWIDGTESDRNWSSPSPLSLVPLNGRCDPFRFPMDSDLIDFNLRTESVDEGGDGDIDIDDDDEEGAATVSMAVGVAVEDKEKEIETESESEDESEDEATNSNLNGKKRISTKRRGG